MTDDIYEIPSTTPDLQTELAQRLQELVPEAIADGKVDVAKLKELLGEDANTENERFGLFWPGKRRAQRAAQEPTTATLQPVKAQSKEWDTTKNVFIEGDNLEVLKILQKHYHGKIKMIYIDPPYNTGKDFVYPDNYKEGLASYLEFTKQVDEGGKKLSTNSESEGRYHSNWLNMMYPRLKLARNLMTSDGVIFVSIDDHEYVNLKHALDQVFGESNYLNTFVWVSNLKGRQITGVGAVGTKEYILAYARKVDHAAEFRASASTLKAVMPSIYKGFNYTAKEDERGPYVTKNELYNTNSAFNEVTRPNLVFDIYYRLEDGSIKTAPVADEHAYPGYTKISPKKNNNGVNRFHAFRWSVRKVEAESYNLEFVPYGDTFKIFTKVRDVDSTSLKDLMMDITTSEGSSDIAKVDADPRWFDYPKPVSLIKVLTQVGTDSDSIVLDFFAGSGTTAHAVMQLNADDGGNRKFIQVQLPEPLDDDSEAAKAGFSTIAEVGRRRIEKAGESLKATIGQDDLDTGFRAYRLGDTNFSKWRISSATDADALTQHLLSLRDSAEDDATPDSLIAELLLKAGYSLTEQISETDIAGLNLRSVGGGLLLAYLDEHQKPSLEQLREVVSAEPEKFVILEDAFQGDDELKTNLVQICKSANVELWTA